jgi:hypothetical protein
MIDLLIAYKPVVFIGGTLATIIVGPPIVNYLVDKYLYQRSPISPPFTVSDILSRHSINPLLVFIEYKSGIKVIQPEDLTTPSDVNYLLSKYVCIIDTYTLQYRTPKTATWVSIPHTGSLQPVTIVADESFTIRSYSETHSLKTLNEIFPYVFDLRSPIKRTLDHLSSKSDAPYKVNKLYDN